MFFRFWILKRRGTSLLDNKYKRYLIYGFGKIGSLLASYLSSNHKDFRLYDDNIKEGVNILKSLGDIEEFAPECIYIAVDNKKVQEQILQKLAGLACEILTLSEEEIEKLETFNLPSIFFERVNKDIFEKNCFLDAMQKGYLDGNVSYSFNVGLFDSYSYNDIGIEENDIVIDAGASCPEYNDNTTAFFASKTKNMVYSFEPMPQSFANLYNAMSTVDNVKLYPYAIGDENKKVFFKVNYSSSCIVDDQHHPSGTVEVQMVKLDDVIDGRVDFIKMDIEGSELSALEGAQNIIKHYKPKLSICIYHRPQDIYEIPEYIKSLVPEYRIWIVNNEGHYWMGTKIFAKVYE